MPIPAGWTEAQARLRDKMAKALEEEGKVHEPYAVATSRVQQMIAKRRKEKKEGE